MSLNTHLLHGEALTFLDCNGLPLLPHVVTSTSWVLPYALSGPLQDSMRRTTNDSKDTSLPSLFSFFIAINTFNVPIWGVTVYTPASTPPPQWLCRMWPPFPAWPPALSSKLCGESQKEQVLQASVRKASPWPEVARNNSQPRMVKAICKQTRLIQT